MMRPISKSRSFLPKTGLILQRQASNVKSKFLTSAKKGLSFQDRDARDILMNPELFHNNIHNYLKMQAQCSILVESDMHCSDPNGVHVREYLEQAGKINYFSVLPGTKNRFVVQYKDSESANNILYQGRDGAIEGRMVSIKFNKKPAAMAGVEYVSKISPRHESKLLHKLLDEQETMNDQIRIVTEQNFMSSAEIRVRYIFLHVLKRFFAKHLVIEDVLPCGSSLTGAGLPGSDMDVSLLTELCLENLTKPLPQLHNFLDTESTARKNIFQESWKVLCNIESLIKNHLPGAENVQFVSQARVPIVKFNFSIVDLSVDISVNQTNAHSILNMINWYLRYDERVQPTMVILRKWAESKQLLSHGKTYRGLTPFMLQMIILVYLMKIGVIPPLDKIGAYHRDIIVFRSTPSQFKVKVKNKNTDNAEEIICSFFEYFARYGLSGCKMRPINGRITARPYSRSPFWLANPFTADHNIAKNLSKESLDEFVGYIEKTAQLIQFRRKKLSERDWGLNALF